MKEPRQSPRGEKADFNLWSSSLICACSVNCSGKILRWTPAFARLVWGIDLHQNPADLGALIHPEDRAPFLEALGLLCQGSAVIDKRRVRLVPPDGRILLMEVSGERHHGAEGPFALFTFWEISAAEEIISWDSEEENEQVQELLSNFITSLFDPAALVNTEGRLIQVNDALLELLDYRRIELIGHPVALLFENRRDRIREAMLGFAKMMRSGQVKHVPVKWKTREGVSVPVTISSSMLRGRGGGLIGMVVIGRDERNNSLLQELKLKNQELNRAYEELKKLDDMKDDFLSLVGHELRAPLANILGYAEFLRSWDISEKERKEYVEIIYQESQHLRRLVNDILDLSRLEAGRMVFSYLESSINQVVSAAVNTLRPMAEEKGIKLELELGEEIPLIRLDPDRIQQVVSNILHNAIKFSPSGSTVRVITELIEDAVRVSVIDQGIGIPPEAASKVFNRFEQAADVKHHSEGAGLGMSIAKQIVEQGHKGRIWFESEGEGKGTTFRFILPERMEEP